jgi:hypothetical protein
LAAGWISVGAAMAAADTKVTAARRVSLEKVRI